MPSCKHQTFNFASYNLPDSLANLLWPLFFFFFSLLHCVSRTRLHKASLFALLPLNDFGGGGKQTPAPPLPPDNTTRPVFGEKFMVNGCAPAEPGAALRSRGQEQPRCPAELRGPRSRGWGASRPLRVPAPRCAEPRGLRRPLAAATGLSGPGSGENEGAHSTLPTASSRDENKPKASFKGT